MSNVLAGMNHSKCSYPPPPAPWDPPPLCAGPPGGGGGHEVTPPPPPLGGALKQRILSYQTPPCHRRPVTAQQCSAAPQHFQSSMECCLEFAHGLSNVSEAGLGQLPLPQGAYRTAPAAGPLGAGQRLRSPRLRGVSRSWSTEALRHMRPVGGGGGGSPPGFRRPWSLAS